MELTDRRERRIQRRRNASKLPLAKTLSEFDRGRLPKSVDRQLASLLEGDFLEGSKNVQWFGDLSPRTNPPSKLDLGPLTCPGKLYQA